MSVVVLEGVSFVDMSAIDLLDVLPEKLTIDPAE